MKYPSGHRVLSKTEGIVMSINGLVEILLTLVWLKVSFKPSNVSQLMWIVPLSNCFWERLIFLKALNFGSFFSTKLILVQAPLYSMLLILLSYFFVKIFSGWSTSYSKVTRLVQLDRIFLASIVSPFSNLTATGLRPSYIIRFTDAFTLSYPPISRKLWQRISESLPLPPSM